MGRRGASLALGAALAPVLAFAQQLPSGLDDPASLLAMTTNIFHILSSALTRILRSPDLLALRDMLLWTGIITTIVWYTGSHLLIGGAGGELFGAAVRLGIVTVLVQQYDPMTSALFAMSRDLAAVFLETILWIRGGVDFNTPLIVFGKIITSVDFEFSTWSLWTGFLDALSVLPTYLLIVIMTAVATIFVLAQQILLLFAFTALKAIGLLIVPLLCFPKFQGVFYKWLEAFFTVILAWPLLFLALALNTNILMRWFNVSPAQAQGFESFDTIAFEVRGFWDSLPLLLVLALVTVNILSAMLLARRIASGLGQGMHARAGQF